MTANADDAFNDLGAIVDLSVAANSWTSGVGTGFGYGIVKLTAPGFLSVAVGADASGLFPAFNVYQSWGGSGFNANSAFSPNSNNPIDAVNLNLLGGDVSTSGADATWISQTLLATGDYTIIIGDNGGLGEPTLQR